MPSMRDIMAVTASNFLTEDVTERMSVKHSVRVKMRLTADDWELFTHDESLDTETAAKALNRTFEGCVNAGEDRELVIQSMKVIMQRYEDTGANDKEAHAVLDKLLDKVFEAQEQPQP